MSGYKPHNFTVLENDPICFVVHFAGREEREREGGGGKREHSKKYLKTPSYIHGIGKANSILELS